MIDNDYRLASACRLHDAGQIPAAIDVLTELLAERPNDAFCHGLLASCLLMQKRLVAADYEVNIALGLEPELPYLHQVLARLLLINRKPKEALRACDESLRLDPESADCYLLKSSIHRFLEQIDDAKVSLDRAAALEPASLPVAVAYGDLHNAKGEHEEAMEYARQALKINPANDDANVLMGETQLALGKLDEADYSAKFAITQNPMSESALRLFTDIRMRKNRFVGLWWRFNSWLATLGNLKSALVLIGGYLSFNILSEVALDLGYPATSSVLAYGWLILVLYSWIGIPIYQRALARELEKFSFNPNF